MREINYSLRVATAATAWPVTPAALKSYVRVDFDDDDVEVQDAIEAATTEAEKRTRRSFITRTYDLALECFPDGGIVLPAPPAVSITRVRYLVSGAWVEIAAGDLFLALGEPAEVHYIPSGVRAIWPASDDHPESVEVRYVAGYGASDLGVPAGIRTAIAAIAAALYDQKGVQVIGAPVSPLYMSGLTLLDKYVVRDLALT